MRNVSGVMCSELKYMSIQKPGNQRTIGNTVYKIFVVLFFLERHIKINPLMKIKGVPNIHQYGIREIRYPNIS